MLSGQVLSVIQQNFSSYPFCFQTTEHHHSNHFFPLRKHHVSTLMLLNQLNRNKYKERRKDKKCVIIELQCLRLYSLFLFSFFLLNRWILRPIIQQHYHFWLPQTHNKIFKSQVKLVHLAKKPTWASLFQAIWNL